MRVLACIALAACTPPPSTGDGGAGPFHDGTPVITSVVWGCASDLPEWTFMVETEGWTGGGTVWMTRDASSSEHHRIYSASAAADGSSDRLLLTLDVAADWRDAEAGSSSRWQCVDEAELTYLLTVLTPRGDKIADCRIWGLDPQVFSEVDGAPACEHLLGSDSG